MPETRGSSPRSTCASRARAVVALAAAASIGCFTLPGVASAQVSPAERAALVAIHQGTFGAMWTNDSGWLGPAGSECEWQGVLCEVAGHVTAIDLAGNNLTGNLPSLAALAWLEYLDVSGNRIEGTIPPLTGLQQLGFANFAANRFSGPLPSLQGLAALETFYAGNNQLTGTIPALAGLANLTYFNVQSNQLSGSLPALAGMTRLGGFTASGNRLTGGLPSLAGLPNLATFRVHNNQLGGPVPPLSALTSLDVFRIENNLLGGGLPAPPAGLDPGASRVCPNAFTATPSAAWDAATGEVPWYLQCGPLPDPVYASGFD